jgi:hypothetical protein
MTNLLRSCQCTISRGDQGERWILTKGADLIPCSPGFYHYLNFATICAVISCASLSYLPSGPCRNAQADIKILQPDRLNIKKYIYKCIIEQSEMTVKKNKKNENSRSLGV